MSTVTFAFTPLPDASALEALGGLVQQALVPVRVLGRALAWAGASLAMAAVLWLMLAGPGFLTDGASTAAPHAKVVARR